MRDGDDLVALLAENDDSDHFIRKSEEYVRSPNPSLRSGRTRSSRPIRLCVGRLQPRFTFLKAPPDQNQSLQKKVFSPVA